LEKTLRRAITWSERRHLIRIELVRQFESGSLGDDPEENWQEFVKSAVENLRWLRHYREDIAREESGDVQEEDEIEATVQHEPTHDHVNVSGALGKRTWARALALSALNQLYAQGVDVIDPLGPTVLSSRVKPSWQGEGTIAQWIIELNIEAWIPAEGVKNIYRHIQQQYLAKPLPKTQERAFTVAQFVWREVKREGEWPSWPDLLDRWKRNNPDDKGFKSSADFRKYFVRGAVSTLPQYTQSNEDIASEVREHIASEVRRQERFGPRLY
jgi:hypothetical protein